MAITATFIPASGTLSVFGTPDLETITVSRNAAGIIAVNKGAVAILGGAPTVLDTTLLQIFGQAGDDAITLNEANGALPKANLFGGMGNDTLTGGAGADMLFGQQGNDILFGKAGADFLFGGTDDDVLTGGDGDDQLFGESGNDRFVWNTGDDSDLIEGGDGIDTAEVNGSSADEVFAITANGDRVRFDRLFSEPFALDIGTTEKLVLNAGGGDDRITVTGNLAALMALTLDGGGGDDTILGGNGSDVIYGGAGNDYVDGNQGNDVAFLGGGNDVFVWDPGDGSDTVEGDAGTDKLEFFGSFASETMTLAANGSRGLLERLVGNISMDLNSVEKVAIHSSGGTDSVTVRDLSGTGITEVAVEFGPQGQADTGADVLTLLGTDKDETVALKDNESLLVVKGLSAVVTAEGLDTDDRVVVETGAGKDRIDASSVAPAGFALTLDGGRDDDTILGSQGGDWIMAGDGNDIVRGNAGNDVVSLGAGNDTFTWAAGDGFDAIDGLDGEDLLIAEGAGGADRFSLSAIGASLYLEHVNVDSGLIADGIEAVRVQTLGGSDVVNIGNLATTAVVSLIVDLGNDKAADVVSLAGSAGADAFSVSGSGGTASVMVGTTKVSLAGADAKDVLSFALGDSDDNLDASQLGGTNLSVTGGQGNDAIIGGAGNDVLNGGDGADMLTGGAGTDRFVYTSAFESQVGARDTIKGFNAAELDRIDLSGIDANTFQVGDQAFKWRGTAAFGGQAGELRVQYENGNAVVSGDVNGDTVADFAIEVTGFDAQHPVLGSFFVL